MSQDPLKRQRRIAPFEPNPNELPAVDSPTDDTLRLLHELQVHQAELAQQNEELVTARDELETSAQRYFDLYESAPVGLVTLNRDGFVREVNRFGRVLLGDLAHELDGNCLLDRLIEPGRSDLAQALTAPSTAPVRQGVDVWISAPGSGERVLRAVLGTHPAAGSDILLALTDITGQRRSESALARTREILELSNRVARIGYWQEDTSAGTSIWSDIAQEIFELPRDDGSKPKAIIDLCKDDETRLQLKSAQTAALDQGATFDSELNITTFAGRDRWIRVTGRAESTGSRNRRLYGTVQDITAHIQAEAARVAHASAELANRSKNAFLARMSHDLRTPLNAVLGFSEVLELDNVAMALPNVATHVGHIHNAGRHLLAMINEVLDLTRIESGDLHIEMEQVDLDSLIGDCLTLIASSAAAHKVALNGPVHKDGRSVLGDRTRLRQILMNLLSNAVKYNREGGSVDVEVDEDAGRVVIAIRDTGHGLSPDQMGQLFQPFNRLGAEHRGIEGTGLGLVISKQLAEAMGGTIEAQSVPEVGTVLSLRLQCVTGAGQNPAIDALVASENKVRSRERPFLVLYVEDNPVNVELMRAALALRQQVQLEVATDGQEGLDMVRSLCPDLVLLDMGLPIMDGAAVFAHLRDDPKLARIPCIAVSANAMDSDVKEALALGFTDYIVKPFALSRLLELVDRLLASSTT